MDEIEDDVASEEQQDMLAAALLTNTPIDEATEPYNDWISLETPPQIEERDPLLAARGCLLAAVVGLSVWFVVAMFIHWVRS
jgi:hypothetical protein